MRLPLLVAFVGVLLVAATGGSAPDRRVERGLQVVPRDPNLIKIQAFWQREHLRLFGVRSVPVLRTVAYRSSEEATLPSCDGRVFDRSFYEENAFYCRREHVIVYDERLVARLRSDYGDLSVGVLFAHEYAHAVQAQVGEDDGPTLALELQADCFAGAWTASPEADIKRHVGFDQVAAVLRSLRASADPVALAPVEGGHGSGADRVSAFSVGRRGGAGACVDLWMSADLGKIL